MRSRWASGGPSEPPSAGSSYLVPRRDGLPSPERRFTARRGIGQPPHRETRRSVLGARRPPEERPPARASSGTPGSDRIVDGAAADSRARSSLVGRHADVFDGKTVLDLDGTNLRFPTPTWPNSGRDAAVTWLLASVAAILGCAAQRREPNQPRQASSRWHESRRCARDAGRSELFRCGDRPSRLALVVLSGAGPPPVGRGSRVS
jgi:hypothetical protein